MAKKKMVTQDDESIKSKKKMVTQDASPVSKSRPSDSSSSKRSSREISSKKQTKENPTNTRKSERLENMKPSGTPPIKEKSERTQEQMIITPMKRYDRRKKQTSLRSLGLENFVEEPVSSNTKSKKEEVSRSSKQTVMDTSEDKSHEKQGVDVCGRKRKRVATCVNKALSKPQQIKTETGGDNDRESQDESCQANSSSKKDVDKELKRAEKLHQIDNSKNKSNGSKSVQDKDDDDKECSDRTGEESMLKTPKRQCSTSHSSLGNFEVKEINDHCEVEESFARSKKQRTNHGLGKQQELTDGDTTCNTDLCDTPSSKDRTTCEAAGFAEIVEKNNSVSRMRTSICFACKLDGKLRYCDAVGCNRCYHLSCLDPPVNNVPFGNWRCSFCVKNNKSSVPSVSGVIESIWDTREVEVSDKGLRKQKLYFVKYKGLAHIHNQWVTETKLLCEAPQLVGTLSLLPYFESLWLDGSMKWTEEWTVPHHLLKKRLVLSFKSLYEDHQNAGKVLNYHYEWLVKWQGLGYEQATWELENISVLDSPEGHKLIKEYEKHHGNTRISALPEVKIEELPVRLPSIPSCPPGMDNIHLNYVKNLHDAWNKRQNNIVFEDQERAMRIVLFIISLKDVTLPFLLITTSDSLSRWEAMFLKIAPCNDLKVSLEETESQSSSRLLEVQKEGGQLEFQVLLFPVDAFVKDLNVLKAIKWEAVIVDESQSLEISAHFRHIESLSANKRLLIICSQLSVNMAGYLDMLSLLDCDGALPNCVISKTELNDISRLKETLSEFIAYECKSSSSKFVEFWVPVQISNVQLEQYCSMLLSNAMALSSCSKSDTFGALRDILVSNRKCCDHPYIVDQRLQGVMTKDLEPAKFLDVGIKASGKLQFLDLILPEMRKRQLRILILFQPLSGSGKGSASIGDILDDFVRQRFGGDSYERIDGIGTIPSKKQAALNNFNNKEMGRFIFLLEYRACLPSIKLSSVDTIVIFDSEWNPANDLRALQKIAIDSQSEQIMIFRLYTSWTLEEKILRLAEHNVTIDSKLQNLSRSTSDALLMWGATYLFNRLAEFHSASELHGSSEEECLWNELTEEFLNLISHECKNKDPDKLRITRVQPISGTYSKNLLSPSELITHLPDGEQPHTFWKNLLVGRNPSWKYLSMSTPRQRKRPQYCEESPKKKNAGNDDVGRKRKKTTNNIVEPLASKPVTEEGEIPGACTGAARVLSHEGSQSSPDDSILCAPSCDEMSFRRLLKLNISKLCEVLKLSVDVKIMVENFLEYVIENYRVNKEPANTLQAFLISLCWIGSALLKLKLDRRQSLALANEHLNFSCKEEEVNSVYLKLEPAKEMFLHRTENQKKSNLSKDLVLAAAQATLTRSLDPRVSDSGPFNPQGVKVEILESPRDQYVDDAIILMEHVRSENCKSLNEETLLCSKQILGSADGGTNSVEVDCEVFEEVSGIRNEEQSKRTCSSGNSIRSKSFHTSVKQIVDVTESSEPAEDIPAKKHEGVPTDVRKQVNSVGMKVVAADCNKKIGEAGTIILNGSHYEEDRNDISPNDVEGHAMGAVAVKRNQKHAECGTVRYRTSDAPEDKNDSGSSNGSTFSAAALKEKVPPVQLFVSPACDQSVPTNLDIQKESLRANEVHGSPTYLVEISNLQATDAGKVDQVNPEDSSLQPHHELCFPLPTAGKNESRIRPAKEKVLEITNDGKTLPYDSGVPNHPAEKLDNPSDHTILQSRVNMERRPVVSAETPLGEQHPDLHSSDRVSCQPIGEPLNFSQNPEAPPQVLEMTTEVPYHNATPPGPNPSNVQGSNNHNQGALRMHCQFMFSSNPLEAELEKLRELKDSVITYHEAIKLKLKSDYDKELAEMIAQMNRKYEAKRQDAEAAFQLKKKEVDINFNRVIMNKILAEAFRSKCQDLHPSDHGGIQVTRSGGMRHPHTIQSSMGSSAGVTSSPAQFSANQQVTKQQPPLQIVNQPAKLFSTTPSKPSSNTDLSSTPTRPTSNLNPITSSSMPSIPPSNVVPISPTSTPSRPPPNINPITPSSRLSRPPPNINPVTPSSGPSRPPPNINPVTPASEVRRPPPNINPVTPSSGPSMPPHNINPINPSSRPPTNSNPNTPSARKLRVTGEIRAPAPHIRPFKPSTSVSHDRASPRVMSSQHTSTSLPLSSPTLSQSSSRPPLPPSLQTPTPFPVNQNSHPVQNSPRSLPAASPLLAQASSQPPESVSIAPPASVRTELQGSVLIAPPASVPTELPASTPIASPASVPVTPLSFQLPSSYPSLQSEQHPPGDLPAMCSSLPQISLPPMPSISISHSGLYSASGRPESGIRLPSPDILSLPALDLLMDIDKQAGFHPPNMLPSPPEFWDASDFGKGVAASDLVCLSDDD